MSIFSTIFGGNADISKDTKVVVEFFKEQQAVFTIEEALNKIIARENFYELKEMMFYNVPVRNAIREKGINYVAEKILSFVPANQGLATKMEEIVKNYAGEELGDLDIQMMPDTAPLCFFGKRVTYEELFECREVGIYARGEPFPIERKNEKLHVACIFEGYPCFDEHDYAYENRSYWNFFISDRPFTEQDCLEMSEMRRKYNACYVCESLPAKYLPAIYWVGDGNFILVATERGKSPKIPVR